MEKMVAFWTRMNEDNLPQHEAKALDMLAKATGIYKAPEKNETARERSDAEILDDLKSQGMGLDGSTPNRREDGPGGRGKGPEVTDLQTLPETETFSRTRPN